MTNVARPSTSCQIQRPSLTDDENDNGKHFLSRSFTADSGQTKQRLAKPFRSSPPIIEEQQRLTKSHRSSAPVIDQQQRLKKSLRSLAPAFEEEQQQQQQSPQRLGRSLLSNDSWRQETMVDIRVNAKAIDQSDQNILFGKGIDPLPHVREMLNELSNAEAFLYARQCRVVVAKLRLCWSDINEEIKSLLKHKEYTEATIDHIRKDLIINKESVNIRKKPKREAEPDGVDDILAAEKYHLKNLKKILELHCKNILEQMQKLDEVRQRVTKIGKERSVVTELICQCLTSASRTFELARIEKLDIIQQQQQQQQQQRRPPMTAPARPSSALGLRPPRPNLNNSLNSTITSSTSNINIQAESTLLDENGLPFVDNLLAFTPDVIQAFQDAAKLIEESREIKKQAMNQIRDAFNDAKAYSITVNQSIAQKLADIITLAQHLTISLGENVIAQNRAQRWFDVTMSAQRSNAGPISSANFKIPERLDRPIIRTFQRHPGNQVPDAQITAKATVDLLRSAEETRKQLKALKIVGQRLQANLIDKQVALGVDAHLLRRRRERSNHKWGVTKYVHV